MLGDAFEGSLINAAVVRARRDSKRLRDLIDDSDVSLRRLEERLRLERGYLSQLLNGYIELKYWHLLAILEGLEVAPGEFLAELFPSRLPGSRSGPDLKVDRKSLMVYSVGIEAIRELRARILECERQLIQLRDSGELDRLIIEAETGGDLGSGSLTHSDDRRDGRG